MMEWRCGADGDALGDGSGGGRGGTKAGERLKQQSEAEAHGKAFSVRLTCALCQQPTRHDIPA